MKFGTLFLVV